jgi:uncharacterized protein
VWRLATRKCLAEPTTEGNAGGAMYIHRSFKLFKEVGRRIAVGKTIDVVLKVTERCNLACPYCYFFFGGDESHALHPPTVQTATVIGLIDYIRRSVTTSAIDALRVILHGGEPLLLKKQSFDTLCDALRVSLGPLCNLTIALQTNGVLLDKDWIDLFEKHGVTVGVSMDGEPEAHDKTRITKRGKGTYKETRQGWDLLKAAAEEGRIEEPGLICVIDPKNNGRTAYEHFANEMRAKQFNFLLPDVNHDTPGIDDTFVRHCTRYLTEVFEAWSAQGDSSINVRFITESLYPLVSDDAMASLCSHSSQGQSLIAVSSNGEIVPNDVLRGLSPEFRSNDITVFNSDLDRTLRSPAWKAVAQAESSLCDTCMQCEWRNVCRGGSPQHRYSRNNGFDNPSVFCEGLKSYFTVLARRAIRAGIEMEKIGQRLEADWSTAASGVETA